MRREVFLLVVRYYALSTYLYGEVGFVAGRLAWHSKYEGLLL